jgi:hypothetical protein
VKPFSQRLSRTLLVLPLALLLTLSACDLTTVGQTEQIANIETIRAGTPSPTATPTATLTPTPTATVTPTVGPTATPTPTPLPPTPTPNPALVGFGFCDQRVGTLDGRFSARLLAADASGTPAFEQVVLRFELAPGSAPLGAVAVCAPATDLDAAVATDLDGAYALRVRLPGWLRDEAFRSSPITSTLTFSGTRVLTGARLLPATDPDAGVDLLIGLPEPLPFRLTLDRNPTRLTLAVARTSSIVAASDQLRAPTSGGPPDLEGPAFILFDGDIWRVEAGQADAGPGLAPVAAGVTNLTASPDTETTMAVSPDGTRVAFCRSAPGLDPADADLPVPGVLWIMNADGSDARPLAQVGVGCADPAFSPDGARVAFAVDETGVAPIQRTLYAVSVEGGRAQRLIEGSDEWSRFAPQWLEGGALIFAATSQDGRSTLFLRNPRGEISDVGARVLVNDNGDVTYRALGRPLAAPDGSRFAVEALRNDGLGADLVVFDAGGGILEVIGAAREVPPTPTPTPSATPTTAATAEPANTGTPASGAAEGGPTATAAGTATTPAIGTTTTPAAGTAPAPAIGTATTPAAGTAPAPAIGTAPAPAIGTATTPAAGTAPAPAATPTARAASGSPTVAATAGTAAPAATPTARAASGSPTVAATAGTAAPAATGNPTAPRNVTASPAATGTATARATVTATGTPTASATPEQGGTPAASPSPSPTLEPEPPAEPRREGPYWTRPLAWDGQGRLIYLTTLCASQVVQEYQVYRWAGARRSEMILTGSSLGGIGAATMDGQRLLYVLTDTAPPGARGPQARFPRGPSSLWAWDISGGQRGELLRGERGITALNNAP